MGDDTIRAVFESLDAEPRPEFIARLRRRVEHEWADEGVRAGLRDDRDHRPVAVELEGPPGDQPAERDRGRRWTVAIVFTAVAVTLAVLVFVVRTRDEVAPADRPVPTGPTTSAAPSLPPTTVLPAVEELGVVCGRRSRSRARLTRSPSPTTPCGCRDGTAPWSRGSTLATDEVITVDVGFTGTLLAADEDGVWVGVDGGLLLRLDPDSGEVIATIETSTQPVSGDGSAPAPYTGEGAVWVHDLANRVASRVDLQTNEVTDTVDLEAAGIGGAEGMVIADGLVRVNTCGGPVSIDPQTLAVSEPIALDGCAGHPIGFADGSLWVGLTGRRTARIDPVDREVEVILDVGPVDEAPGLATGDGRCGSPSHHEHGRSHRHGHQRGDGGPRPPPKRPSRRPRRRPRLALGRGLRRAQRAPHRPMNQLRDDRARGNIMTTRRGRVVSAVALTLGVPACAAGADETSQSERATTAEPGATTLDTTSSPPTSGNISTATTEPVRATATISTPADRPVPTWGRQRGALLRRCRQPRCFLRSRSWGVVCGRRSRSRARLTRSPSPTTPCGCRDGTAPWSRGSRCSYRRGHHRGRGLHRHPAGRRRGRCVGRRRRRPAVASGSRQR